MASVLSSSFFDLCRVPLRRGGVNPEKSLLGSKDSVVAAVLSIDD